MKKKEKNIIIKLILILFLKISKADDKSQIFI